MQKLPILAAILFSALAQAEPTLEWTLHRSADLRSPNGEEQELLWLMNRARQNPAAEGAWLATESDPDVALGRNYFGVDVAMLRAEFAAYSRQPPAAFDARLHRAAKAHSEDMRARDAQDHSGQVQRVTAQGYDYRLLNTSVFSYASSALNAHAAFNIDWGTGPGGMQDGRKHRDGLLSLGHDFTNVGIAVVTDNNPATNVGTRIVSANYAAAFTDSNDHFNRFIVGTVWKDHNGNRRYDAGEGYQGVLVRPDRGTFYAKTSPGGGFAIPIEAAGSYRVRFSGGGIGAAVTKTVSLGEKSALVDYRVGEPVPTGVDLNGIARDANGTPLCTMVLASGQYVFSCDPNGHFSLRDLPQGRDGSITLQVYADGFNPQVVKLNSFGYQQIVMNRAGSCPEYGSEPLPGYYPERAGQWINISGRILQQNSANPVCAMALASGQYTFTCDGTGSYDFWAPLDSNGRATLQVYADGFAPKILELDAYNTSNVVRLARGAECR